MNFVINDLSMYCQSKTDYDAIVQIRNIILLIKELKKSRVLNTIYSDKKFTGIQLAPNYYVEQMLNDSRLTKDERIYIKSFLVNFSKVTPNSTYTFEIGGYKSFLLAHSYFNNFFVISMKTNPLFSRPYLEGLLNNTLQIFEARLPNLVSLDDVEIHKSKLGIRIYENNPKHKVNYGWGSPMDLEDDMAQKILDTAIPVPNNLNHLINFYNNKYYSFRRHHENYFHGYIDNSLSENIKKLLNGI